MAKRGGDPKGYKVGIKLINQVVRYRNESVTGAKGLYIQVFFPIIILVRIAHE